MHAVQHLEESQWSDILVFEDSFPMGTDSEDCGIHSRSAEHVLISMRSSLNGEFEKEFRIRKSGRKVTISGKNYNACV